MEVLTPIVLAGGGTGGGGTPGGSDTQVQFNDGGAFGGDAGLTYDDTNGSLSVGGKTVTASEPVLDLSQTWNNAATAFTGLKFNATNAASASDSKLLDLQVGGTSQVYAFDYGSQVGLVFDNDTSNGFVGVSYGQFTFGSRVSSLFSVGRRFLADDAILKASAAGGFGWSYVADSTNTADLKLLRDAAGTLAQRNGTNAQTYRLYNTYTDASNYERGFLQWNSNVLEIGSEGAGTGSEQPVRITAATLKLPNLPTYADNTAATSGGLVAGDVYQTATGELRITV